MNDFIDLPIDLANLNPRTFALIDVSWSSVREFFLALYAQDVNSKWLNWSELPCRLYVRCVGVYQGDIQLAVLRPSVELPSMCTIWTTEADSAHSFLYKLAYRTRCRIISTTFCFDWASENAMAGLMIFDGRETYCERVVRVMRGDSGRLEYFESGNPVEFEPQSGFGHGLLRKRLSEDVLLSIWTKLGVDLKCEMVRAPERRGLVYVQARNGPLSPGQAFSVVA